jgi:hypothetical protein
MLILMSNMFNVPVGIHEQFRNGVVYELGYLVRSGVVDCGVSTLCKRLFEMFKWFFFSPDGVERTIYIKCFYDWVRNAD